MTTHLASANNTTLSRSARSITPTGSPVTPTPLSTAPTPTSAVTSAPAASPKPTRTSTHSAAPTVTQQASSQVASPAPPKPVLLLSQGRPATSSSVQGYPWAAKYAVDGNLTTRWSSAWSDPQWLQVDLGAIYTIHSVVLYWENAFATAFQIQVSDNGTTWTDIDPTVTGFVGKQTLEVSGSGRYVRMYGTHRNTQYGYSLWEFQVFGN
jgi:F5/8 type C domain